MGQPRIPGTAQPLIILVNQVPIPFPSDYPPGDLERIVPAPVINTNDFEILAGLPRDTVQALRQISRHIVDRDDDGKTHANTRIYPS